MHFTQSQQNFGALWRQAIGATQVGQCVFDLALTKSQPRQAGQSAPIVGRKVDGLFEHALGFEKTHAALCP